MKFIFKELRLMLPTQKVLKMIGQAQFMMGVDRVELNVYKLCIIRNTHQLESFIISAGEHVVWV